MGGGDRRGTGDWWPGEPVSLEIHAMENIFITEHRKSNILDSLHDPDLCSFVFSNF